MDYRFLNNPDDAVLIKEFLKDKKEVSLDIETDGLSFNKNKILLFQIGTDQEGLVCDASILDPVIIKPFLEDKSIRKIIHNALFEMVFFWKYGIRINNVHCTYITERMLYAGKYSLSEFALDKVLYRIGIDVPFDKKSLQESFIDHGGDFSPEQIEYARFDTKYLQRLKHIQVRAIQNQSLQKLYHLEHQVLYPTFEMMVNGVSFNHHQWKELTESNIQKRSEVQTAILNQVPDKYTSEKEDSKLNLNSPIQVKNFLHDIGFNVKSTDSKVLNIYANPEKPSVIDEILEYRKLNKLISTYGYNIIDHMHNGRVYTSFNPYGADTGRYTSSNPNMQNMPRSQEYRSCFQASEGSRFIIADYKSQELHLIIQACDMKEWNDLIREGYDLHQYFADNLFHTDRQTAKNALFGLCYGQGYKGLAKHLNLDEDEAYIIKQRLYEAYPKLFHNMSMFSRHCNLLRKVKGLSPFSRIRYWDPDYPEWKVFLESRNFPIQGGGADVMKLALVKLYEASLPVKFILTVHDEAVLECDSEKVEELVPKVKRIMEDAGKEMVPSGLMEVDLKVSEVWEK